MPAVDFAPPSIVSGHSGYNPYSDGIGLPTGRVMANGSIAVLITDLRWYAGTYSGAPSAAGVLGSTASAYYGMGGGVSLRGWVACAPWLVAGGTARFTLAQSGSGQLSFGRGGAGTNVHDNNGNAWSGTLAGSYYYRQAPAAPAIGAAVTQSNGSITLNWGTPDNGESALTGYYIERANNPAFTGATAVNVGVVNSYNTGVLAPGTYYFRVAAKNAVTAAAGTVSVFSGTVSAIAASGFRAYNGAAFVNAVSSKVWTGVWTPSSSVRVWNGVAWVPAV